MRSSSRLARMQLLTFAILLAFLGGSGAVAQTVPPSGTDEGSRVLRRLDLGAIVDDPDPIPPLFVDPTNPSRSVVGVSERQRWIAQFFVAASLGSCLPTFSGTQCAAGLDLAVRALASPHRSSGLAPGSTR